MKRKIGISILAIIGCLLVAISFQNKYSTKKTFGPLNRSVNLQRSLQAENKTTETASTSSEAIQQKKSVNDSLINDSIYNWDQKNYEWVVSTAKPNSNKNITSINEIEANPSEPIKIDWFVLENIQYNLKFFNDLETDVFAPIFGEVLEALHEKEVIIKGFVIPIFEDEGPLALSANPYASCFFCGQASPASVLSMYMKKKGKKYKADDYKEFKGTLFLNYDDPNEFYYILKNAVQID